MKLKLYWKNILILESTEIDSVWYNQINTDNIIKTEKLGIPQSLLSNTRLISEKMPNIIEDRIPKKADKLEYIKKTNCKRATDFFSVHID